MVSTIVSAGNLAAKLLLDLLEVYTPSGREYEAIPVLEEWSRRLGLLMSVDSSGSIRLRPPGWGEAQPLIMLASHLDTVPGMLPVRVMEGAIHGRGAVDAKGPLSAMIVGLALASESGIPCAAEVAALSGEEADSPGAWGLVRRGEVAPFVVIGEPTGGDGVAISYRGSLKLAIECRSGSGHSSSVGGGAGWALVDALNVVRGSLPEAVLTMISGGSAPNVTPEAAEAVLDLRFESDAASIINRVSIVCRDVDMTSGCGCSRVELTSPIKVSLSNIVSRTLVSAIRRQGVRPRIVKKLGTSDMNILGRVAQGIAAYGPGDPRLAHTPSEKIGVADLELAAKIYAETILTLCHMVDGGHTKGLLGTQTT
ncbi:MAG: N-acetyl-lysine deacetylase [Aeropyrum sp.]|nr:N-acetyl-lysine deacetylase [Aeropyrum sp.]